MILFLYGPNTYFLKEKVNELKDKYKQKSGNDFSLLEKDLKEGYKFSDLEYELLTIPFFASTRFVVLKNIFELKKEEAEKFLSLCEKKPETTILCLVHEGEPDKRLKFFQNLIKNTSVKSQYFAHLTIAEIERFIREKLADSNAKIQPRAATLLAQNFEQDLWGLSNEIQKLISAKIEITEEYVRANIHLNEKSDIFNLVNYIALSKVQEAVRETRNLILKGDHPLMILSILNYQVRTLALIKSNYEKSPNPTLIAKMSGLSPFQVSKNLNYAKTFSWIKLKNIYRKLCVFDEQAKTGKIEPESAMMQLVIELCLS